MNRKSLSLFLLTFGLQAAEIPRGTELTVRMADRVDSRTHELGHLFRATIDEPVSLDGKVVFPRGAAVVTKLTELKEAGKLTGKTELSLSLVSITHDGVTYNATSSAVKTATASKTKKTGAVVGGAAVLGAAIGAIAGGGKGAAIGALSGAGAGGAYQVFTQGDTVYIPTETRLTFSLAEPLEMK